jgi:hypothetical protein
MPFSSMNSGVHTMFEPSVLLPQSTFWLVIDGISASGARNWELLTPRMLLAYKKGLMFGAQGLGLGQTTLSQQAPTSIAGNPFSNQWGSEGSSSYEDGAAPMGRSSTPYPLAGLLSQSQMAGKSISS